LTFLNVYLYQNQIKAMKFKILLIIVSLILFSCNRKAVVEEIKTSKYLPTEEIEIEVEKNVMISGTLEYVSPKHLVIIIAGLGPTDRDCNSVLGLKTDAFKLLARSLTMHGVSSFRYDKRGIGKSTKVEESDLLVDTYVSDVISILNHLKSDFDQIILLGHSEGALIGSIASMDEKVNSFISVSGTSISVDKIILDQLKSQPVLAENAKKHIDEILTNQPLSEVDPLLQSAFRPSLVPFLKSLFEVDPMNEITKLDKPVLVIGGICDWQVPIQHAKDLDSGAIDSKLVMVNRMGHLLKNLNSECNNVLDAYSNPEMELNPEFVKAVLNFIGCDKCL